MKTILMFIALLCLMSSCEEEQHPPFEREKMKQLLIQIHMTDSALTSLMGDQKDSMSAIYDEQIQSINQVSGDEIESIFTYLKSNPSYANELYEEMIKEVKKLQYKDKQAEKNPGKKKPK